MSAEISRRDALKLSGAALGSLALPAWVVSDAKAATPSSRNALFNKLSAFDPRMEPVAPDAMRISFMGTSVIERRAQQRMSLFVELGNGDSFVFDIGSGSVSNYVAMGVPWSKMRRIFLTHLHGDHTSDLTHIYCFGPQGDGKSPLYLFGPSRSRIPNPGFFNGSGSDQFHNPQYFEDGILDFAYHFREMNRWHTESQSFVGTRWKDGPGGPAAPADGYDIYATELDWKTGESGNRWTTSRYLRDNPGFNAGKWIAYQNNGVKISFFPAIHDRNGSISYKLEWKGLSMIFTGDTKPNHFLIDAASAGKPVDVLVSEIVVDPDVWVSKQSGITDPTDPTYQAGLLNAEAVQLNSHTPQKAFGYILNRLANKGKAPRLAVGTHFQSEDDTNAWALEDIRAWYSGEVAISTDLMVIDASRGSMQVRRASVSDYSWSAKWTDPRQVNGTYNPKYADPQTCNPYRPMGPLNQLDKDLLAQVIPACDYDKAGFMCTQPYPTTSCKVPQI